MTNAVVKKCRARDVFLRYAETFYVVSNINLHFADNYICSYQLHKLWYFWRLLQIFSD